MLAHIDIRAHDSSIAIDIVAVNARAMIFVLKNDAEAPRRRAIPFASTRDARARGELLAAVEVGLLLAQIDDDGRRTGTMRRRDVRRHHIAHGAAAAERAESGEKEARTAKSVHEFSSARVERLRASTARQFCDAPRLLVDREADQPLLLS